MPPDIGVAMSLPDVSSNVPGEDLTISPQVVTTSDPRGTTWHRFAAGGACILILLNRQIRYVEFPLVQQIRRGALGHPDPVR